MKTTGWVMGAALVSLTSVTMGQDGGGGTCPPYTTSFLSTWDRAAPLVIGEPQHPQAAWRFASSRDGGVLLEGVQFSNAPVTWGDPTGGFFLPAFGSRYSPNAARNQSPFFARQPSFEGVMFHPAFGNVDVIASFYPRASARLFGLTMMVEHLGNFSPDVVITARVQRASGAAVTLVPPTTVLALASARTLNATPGTLPITFGSGDRVVILANAGGGAEQDWFNVNATLTIEDAPAFISPPRNVALCATGETATFAVVVDGAGPIQYRWQRRNVGAGTPWVNLSNGPLTLGGVQVATVSGATTSQLNLARGSAGSAFLSLDGIFRCVATDVCRTANSPEASMGFCVGDYTCDGSIDGDDVIAFFDPWDQSLEGGDINGDGGVDGDDVVEFFAAWDTQCGI